MNTRTNTTNGRKIAAIVAVICAAVAIILAAIMFLGHEDRISSLEKKIENGTLNSSDITEVAEAEGMTREEVLAIVAQYIADNKIDTSAFVTRNEVADMIATAIKAYDATRFDANGHCLCCPEGQHVSTTTTEYVDRTVTEYVDNSTHTTEYVENPVDLSNYYTADEVDQMIHDILSQQVQNTIPETNSEDQNTVTNFIEADPGFQGEVNGNDDTTFVQPSDGEQGAGGANEATFVEPGEGFQGENNNGGNANVENPVGNGEVIDLRTGNGDAEITDPVQPTESTEFVAPSDGFEGNVTGNSDNGFEAPAEGTQGSATNEDNGFVAPDEGYENGSDEGQVIDLRGIANDEAPVEPSEPAVGFDGVVTEEIVDNGFVMPGEGIEGGNN